MLLQYQLVVGKYPFGRKETFAYGLIVLAMLIANMDGLKQSNSFDKIKGLNMTISVKNEIRIISKLYNFQV